MSCYVMVTVFITTGVNVQDTCEWVTSFYNVGGMQDDPYNNSNLTHILTTCLD